MSGPARVLFVDHTPTVGGAELALGMHIAALDRARFHPLVACTDVAPSLVELYRRAGAEVHVISLPRLRRLSVVVPLALLRAAVRLRRLVRRERVDLVVANTSRAAYIASVALMGSRVPLVWWVRDFLFGRWAFRGLVRRADRVVFVSHATRSFYERRPDHRFRVVHVGSSLHEQLPCVSDDDVRAERARWGLSHDDVVVGFMGRLVDEKGAEDAIEAVALAHAADPRIKLLVVGSGRGQLGDVEPHLHRFAHERRMDFVAFAGFQSAQALYYRLFDIFVLTTRTAEAYATSIVEAMMAGVPVIATATGGTPELVWDTVTGLLVPPAEPGALAAAVLRLAGSPALRRTVAEAALAEVMANNREAVTTSKVEAIYSELLGERRVSSGRDRQADSAAEAAMPAR